MFIPAYSYEYAENVRHTKAIVTPSQYAQKDGVISIHYITRLPALFLLFFRAQFFLALFVEMITHGQHAGLRFG